MTLLLIVLILLLIVLFLLLIAQSMKTGDSQISKPEQTQELVEEEIQSEVSSEDNIEEDMEPSSELQVEKKNGYIIIGDSHVVVADSQGYAPLGSNVEGIVYNQTIFFIHTGLDPVMGTFEWLKGAGTEKIQDIMEEHLEITDWCIISIHGTSMVIMPDIENQYVQIYKQWINDTFNTSRVYIVSVPPLDEKEWVVKHADLPPRYNQDIIDFNSKMKENFEQNYFDYYTWFLENGEFQDEIHYTGKTYQMMFDEIIQILQN